MSSAQHRAWYNISSPETAAAVASAPEKSP